MAGKDKKRPSLGWGMAEKGAKDIEAHKARRQRRLAQAMGNADKDKDKPQGKADKD